MSDPILPEGRALIERNEGCRQKAYLDSVGVPTIGYGHTGPDVHLGLGISLARADELLAADLEKFQDGVGDLLGSTPTSDHEYSAMVSLAYNIGLGNFGKSSVLRAHLAGHREIAADAFRMWNKAGGRVLAGLTRRREEERAMYLTEDVA